MAARCPRPSAVSGRCVSAVVSPLARKDGHLVRIDPGVLEVERLPPRTLVDEADLLVDASGAGVEVVDLEFHTVQPLVLERVPHREPGCFGAETPITGSGDPDAKPQ